MSTSLEEDEQILAQINNISSSVAEASPLVAGTEPLTNLLKEYSNDEKFSSKIQHLQSDYSTIRRVRGDGNCFYRAYTYCLFECCKKDPELLARIVKKLETTLDWLIKMGFPSFTTEDFYETFLDTLKACCEDTSLDDTINNDGMSNYLVVYIRLLTSGQLQEKADDYIHFLDGNYLSMKDFCDKEVMPVDREADHLHIMALCSCLEFPVKIMYVDRTSGGPTEINFPDGTAPTVTLLYRPGHYDILYK